MSAAPCRQCKVSASIATTPPPSSLHDRPDRTLRPRLQQHGALLEAASALHARRLSGSCASTSSTYRPQAHCQRRRSVWGATGDNGGGDSADDVIELTYSAEVMPPGDVVIEDNAGEDDEFEGEEEFEEDETPDDWWSYWQDPPDDVLDDSHEKPLRVTAKEKVEDLLARLPEWRERDDFVAPLPVPTVKEYERELPEHTPPPLNPDWDAWDFRAYVEKKKRKARERAAWEASMAEVGRFEYLSVAADNDMRLKEHGQPAKDWTEEEIWEFITLGGTAVDPRRVKGLVRVEDPVARVDILEQGGRYIESTEDFLRRTGHWLETEPPEEEIDAQLASDFADFAEPELQAGAGVDEGGFTSLARVEDSEEGEPADDNAGGQQDGVDEQDTGDAPDV